MNLVEGSTLTKASARWRYGLFDSVAVNAN
jgi:hypothetical protein